MNSAVRISVIALVGLTAWAIASVSFWLVPVYLALMVLIFVAPRNPHSSRGEPGSTRRPMQAAGGEVDTGLRADHAMMADEHRPIGAPSQEPVVAPVLERESSGSALDSVEPGSAKPRRGRGRGRNKSVNTAVASAPVASTATWVRVGPGKFVRADSIIQTVELVQTETVVIPEETPATEGSSDNRPSSVETERVDNSDVAIESVSETEPAPHSTTSAPLVYPEEIRAWESTASDDAPSAASGEAPSANDGDHVEESVDEVYGITPSAFTLIDDSTPPEIDIRLTDDLFDSVANSDREPRRLIWGRRRPVSERVAPAITRTSRTPSRRCVRADRKPRTTVWLAQAPIDRLRQAAGRALGRISHVQRTNRARSPPSRS